MTIHVAAVNTPTLVASGLSGSLATSGYEIEVVSDPRTWAEAHPRDSMLIGVRGRRDVELLGQLASFIPSICLVALLDKLTPEWVSLCLGSGARGCASMEWSSDRIVMALNAGLDGLALLPPSVARVVTARETKRAIPRNLDTTQQSWLKKLASGMTIHELAGQVGFSERETYRRLRHLYAAMGVRGRTEALMLASASGLLDGFVVDE